MDEKNKTLNHRVIINNRETALLTGVIDVISFDTDAVLVETDMGMLTIKGVDLHVNRLNLEKEELDLDGEVHSVEYSEGNHFGKSGGSLISKLFG